SRRRHTRSKRDWSSDVCSSDLFLRLKNKAFPLQPTNQEKFCSRETIQKRKPGNGREKAQKKIRKKRLLPINPVKTCRKDLKTGLSSAVMKSEQAVISVL